MDLFFQEVHISLCVDLFLNLSLSLSLCIYVFIYVCAYVVRSRASKYSFPLCFSHNVEHGLEITISLRNITATYNGSFLFMR